MTNVRPPLPQNSRRRRVTQPNQAARDRAMEKMRKLDLRDPREKARDIDDKKTDEDDDEIIEE